MFKLAKFPKHIKWLCLTISTCREYRAIPHLDTYEAADLDQDEYEALSPGARAEVERRLRKRDRQEALASGRMRPGLLYDASEDDEMGAPLTRRRRPTGEGAAEEGMDFEEVYDYYIFHNHECYDLHVNVRLCTHLEILLGA